MTCRPLPSPRILLSGTRTSVSLMWACRWAIECPEPSRIKARQLAGTKTGMPPPSPAAPSFLQNESQSANAGVPRFLTVDDPFATVFHHGYSYRHLTVFGFGDAKCETSAALGGHQPSRLLLFSAVVDHEQQPDVVADDRVFVLKVVVKAEARARCSRMTAMP